MDIYVQIKSLTFSFFYGIFFSFILNINYKYIYSGLLIYRTITNLLFVINNVLIYFIILKKINNGIIHPYFFIMTLIGFFVFNSKVRKKDY
jgi:hypothetical protein